MRGRRERQVSVLAFVDLEARVLFDHPLRIIKAIADQALEQLASDFDQMYAAVGRPSIPPERLLKASLLSPFSRSAVSGPFARSRTTTCCFAVPGHATDRAQLRPHGVHQESERI